MGEVLPHTSLGGGRTLYAWEVIRCSDEICPDVWVRDVGGNTLHTQGYGESQKSGSMPDLWNNS